MTNVPFVTVLIPALNEEQDIERCLEAVLDQDHPHDGMEIVLVDGGSTDGTAHAARRFLEGGDVGWTIMTNQAGSTPSNLNAGLQVARGEIVCRVDTRSIIPREYVRTCVALLDSRTDIAVVGGAQLAIPRQRTNRAIGIARALNNRFSMGGSRYRASSGSGAADTVYLGAFRTDELRAVGGWDEWFETNQDFELNRRLGRSGTVWFESSLRVGYLPRETVLALSAQYHRFGRWKVRYWSRTGDAPQPRQWTMMIGASLALTTGAAITVWSRRRPSVMLVWLVLVTGSTVVVEFAGSTEPKGGVLARAWAVAAISAVSVGWISGVWREFGLRMVHR